jgi:hypothetical protein
MSVHVYRVKHKFIVTDYIALLCSGTLKGVVGLCYPTVGAWGLGVFVKHAGKIPQYYEEELRDRPVIFDSDGFPVHPDTRLRTVRTMSRYNGKSS